MNGKSIAFVFVSAATCTGAMAQEAIASQDFDSGQSASGVWTDSDQSSFLDPATGEITGGTSHVFNGSGLGWTLFWEDTVGGNPGPIAGNDNDDIIGVESSGDLEDEFNIEDGLSGNAFIANDVDGTLSIVFDAVDATMFEDLELSFRVAVNFSEVDLIVNDTQVRDLSGGEDQLESVTVDLSSFDGSGSLVIEFAFFNTGPNDFGAIDRVELSGVLIPAPGAVWVAAIGIAIRRRR